jgi:hypothetical protein
MRAQVTLTPSESKKLLAKSLMVMDSIKRARHGGLLVIHPSSTTLFLVEELIGKRPEGMWACGVVVPKGMCLSWEVLESGFFRQTPSKGGAQDMREFPFSWVLDKGEFHTGIPLGSLLERMGKEDVYVKGANAIDPEGKVGVLYGAKGAGTIGKVIAASRRRGFEIILPVGLEKLIPTPIADASKVASREGTDVAMGTPVGLIPVAGEVVTEVNAIDILSKAQAVVVAAGGLGGAEGSVTLVMRGSTDEVNRALKVVKDVKGAAIPEVFPTDCSVCPYPTCHFRGGKGIEQWG